MVNSGELNGITNKKEAIEKMLTVLEKLGCGEKGVQYKMKDWAFNSSEILGRAYPDSTLPSLRNGRCAI